MPPVESNYLQSASLVRAIIAHSLFFASVLILTASPLYAVDQSQTDSIRSSVIALDSARQTALHDLESLPEATREMADYRDFIIYLNTRIVFYCMELAEQAGTVALEGLPCPTGQMMTGAERSPPPSEEEIFYTTGSGTVDTRTQDEKTSDLDAGLLTALGEFDEMLLKEEDKVAARVPSQREPGTSSGAGAAGSGEAGGTGEQGAGIEGDAVAKGGSESRAGQSGRAPGTQSNVGAGNGDVDHSAYGAPGGKLPPPEDDDIVARQLREAAEKEPDLELKKKLFEEYWKYKGVSK